jgi:hypothetical protein
LVTFKKKNRGSLFDALYGTDAVSEDGGAARSSEYNPVCSLLYSILVFLCFYIFFFLQDRGPTLFLWRVASTLKKKLKKCLPPAPLSTSPYVLSYTCSIRFSIFFVCWGFSLQDRGAASGVERSTRIQLAKPVVGPVAKPVAKPVERSTRIQLAKPVVRKH